MFKKHKTIINFLKNDIFCNKENPIYYKPKKITSATLNKDIILHTGNMLIYRNHNYLFISRNLKFNIFFKKPLVRPTKKKKK